MSVVTKLLVLPFALLAVGAYHSSIRPLPAPLRAELQPEFWHKGCPVALSHLRVLTVSHWGFDRRVHTGQLVVNENAAAPLAPRRRQRRVRVPAGVRVALHRPQDDRHVVGACVRAGRRPQPAGESLRGLWNDASRRHEAVPRPLAAAARDGDAGGRRSVPVDRLGLGRRVGRRHEGLHALLGQRALAFGLAGKEEPWPGFATARTPAACSASDCPPTRAATTSSCWRCRAAACPSASRWRDRSTRRSTCSSCASSACRDTRSSRSARSRAAGCASSTTTSWRRSD